METVTNRVLSLITTLLIFFLLFYGCNEGGLWGISSCAISILYSLAIGFQVSKLDSSSKQNHK